MQIQFCWVHGEEVYMLYRVFYVSFELKIQTLFEVFLL
jgi:hypothetical protein